MTRVNIYRRRTLAWELAGGLLVMPLAAMQISDDVRWNAADFASFAVLLIVTGAAFELLLALTRRGRIRLVIGAVLALGFVLAWAHGAVGVFGAGGGS